MENALSHDAPPPMTSLKQGFHLFTGRTLRQLGANDVQLQEAVDIGAGGLPQVGIDLSGAAAAATVQQLTPAELDALVERWEHEAAREARALVGVT